MTYLGGDSMSEWNRLSKSTRVMGIIGFIFVFSLTVFSAAWGQAVMEQRDNAYTQIEENKALISLQNDKIQEQKGTIIKLRATQVSYNYHAPESYGIEHYANPITVEEGLAIIAEFRWTHQRLLNNIESMPISSVDIAWEKKVIERYDSLRELLKRESQK